MALIILPLVPAGLAEALCAGVCSFRQAADWMALYTPVMTARRLYPRFLRINARNP